MYQTITLIILGLDVVAIVECIRSNWTSEKKALWVIIILILPLLGLVAYYLASKKKQ